MLNLGLSNGHWLEKEHIKTELEKVIENIGHFPSAKELNKLKLSGLVNGILNKFGSLREAAKELNFLLPENKPKGYWKVKENVFYELDLIFNKYECIPSVGIISKEKPILIMQ